MAPAPPSMVAVHHLYAGRSLPVAGVGGAPKAQLTLAANVSNLTVASPAIESAA